MSKVNAINPATPAGSSRPKDGDDNIRAFKSATIEILDVDHYVGSDAGSGYTEDDAGKHSLVRFRDVQTDLAALLGASDKGLLAVKNDGSNNELYYYDENGNTIQITEEGDVPFSSVGSVANNTYIKAKNAAGSGTVDLIKANASDIAVIPDGSQMATDAAPTDDKGIANKKYVDDEIAAESKSLGFWAGKSVDTVYQADSDGFVLVTSSSTDQRPYYTVYSDGNSPPTTNRFRMRNTDGNSVHSACVPVKKSDYWKVANSGTLGNLTIYWIPLT